jgi:hypothetical protein
MGTFLRPSIAANPTPLRPARQRAVLAIGKAVSDLVRRGLHAPLETRIVNGFHVVKLPPGSPPVSTEDVEKLLDQ